VARLVVPPKKNATKLFYCQPDIIAVMKKILMQSGNGMNGTEASFNVNGRPEHADEPRRFNSIGENWYVFTTP